MTRRNPYSLRKQYDPPITLFLKPSLPECRAAFRDERDLNVIEATCVAETDNTIYVISCTGGEYGRNRKNYPTYHSREEAIDAAIREIEMKKVDDPEIAAYYVELMGYLTSCKLQIV